MSTNALKKEAWVSILITLAAAVVSVPAAFADGGANGGGGLAGENGELLDFYETNVDPLFGAEKFDPSTLPAYQQRLIPLLREVGRKIPRAPVKIESGVQEMEWYFTDQPIANSNDECALLKKDTVQIAKQIGNKVVVSRQWFQSHDQANQAGLILHELLMHVSSKDPTQCSTQVRNGVRAIFEVKSKSDAELRADLRLIHPSLDLPTRSQSDSIYALLKPRLDAACSEARESEKSITFTNDQIRQADQIFDGKLESISGILSGVATSCRGTDDNMRCTLGARCASVVDYYKWLLSQKGVSLPIAKVSQAEGPSVSMNHLKVSSETALVIGTDTQEANASSAR